MSATAANLHVMDANPDEVRAFREKDSVVVKLTPSSWMCVHVVNHTADETIDLLCEKLQAAKTTEKREG